MHRTSLRILFLALLSVAYFSCKKKDKEPQGPDPEPVDYTLSLRYQYSDNTEGALVLMSAAASDNHLYVAGGGNYGVGSDLYIYTPHTRQWEHVPLSKKRQLSNVSYLKGKVFVAGGNVNIADQFRVDIYDENSKTSSVVLLGDYLYDHSTFSGIIDDRYVIFYGYHYLYVYDSTTSKWETIDIPIANRTLTTGMVVMGSKLYMNDVHNHDSIKIFDFEKRTWSAISSLKHPFNTKFLASDDCIYFYGNTSVEKLNYIDVLDVKTNVWSKIMLPADRRTYEMSIDSKSKSLVITGGYTYNPDGYVSPEPSDDMLIYHIANKNWQQLKLNQARYTHVTQFVGKYFILHGGCNNCNAYPSFKLPTEVYLVDHKEVMD